MPDGTIQQDDHRILTFLELAAEKFNVYRARRQGTLHGIIPKIRRKVRNNVFGEWWIPDRCAYGMKPIINLNTLEHFQENTVLAFEIFRMGKPTDVEMALTGHILGPASQQVSTILLKFYSDWNQVEFHLHTL